MRKNLSNPQITSNFVLVGSENTVAEIGTVSSTDNNRCLNIDHGVCKYRNNIDEHQTLVAFRCLMFD